MTDQNYWEGVDACREGKRRACPYRGQARASWFQGYDDGSLRLRGF
jgi:hypothetical protein